ncbi:hypothetical protein PUR_34930 [Paenibacillus sp. URB8-2]|nr:hypothetical protein PUR_34930 [Paenibacillus sp. URB8-2]
MKLDKSTKKITLQTNEKSEVTNENKRTYNVVINDVKENGDIDAVFTDIETNESYKIEQDKLEASFVWLIPIGVVIGEWLISQLLAAGTAIVIAGVTYVVATEIAQSLRNKQYDHYEAKLMSGKVWIGNAIPLVDAAARLVNPMFTTANQNVWSKSAALAALVAQTAGGGRTPAGPELSCNQVHGFTYIVHYHTWNRVGGHSFF